MLEPAVDSGRETRAVPPPTERRRPRGWVLAGKATASVLLLAWILRRTDLGEVWQALRTADAALLLVALGLCLAGYVLAINRWRLLLSVQGVSPSKSTLVESYLVAQLFNNFLPSTIGGDALRAHDTWRWGSSRGGALAVVFLDRFLGLVALLVFALAAALTWNGQDDRLGTLPFWIALAAIGALIATAMIVWLPRPRIGSLLGRSSVPGAATLLRGATRAAGAFDAFRGRSGVLARAMGLSVLIQADVVLYYYVLARALRFDVPLLTFFLIVPLSVLAMMLPISINGIGLRENAFAFFFGAFGVLPSHSIALAWVDYGFLILPGAAGGIAYALRK